MLPQQSHRRLIVMRHGEAVLGAEETTDHARPLTDNGRSGARGIAAALVQFGWQPDYACASNALRAMQTLEAMRPEFGAGIRESLHHELYNGGYEALSSLAASWPGNAATVIVVGHNPGWENAIRTLSGDDVSLEPASCALLQLTLPCGWIEAMPHQSWQLADVLHTREM
jgi:phosphohistidine phosphatase